MAEFYKVIADHPIITVLIAWFVYSLVVDSCKALRGKK